MAAGDLPRGKRARLGRLARLGAGLLRREDPAERVLRAVATLGDLRGLALKLGQAAVPVLGAAADLQALLGNLYDGASTLPWSTIARVLERELGAPPERRFASIEQEPCAAASLGQVHRAVLADGSRVAVKVQYPGIEEALEDDLASAGAVARLLAAGGPQVRRWYEVGAAGLRGELDYVREREQLEAFRAHYAPWPELAVPRTWPAFSTRRVLTMELFEGPTLHAFSLGQADAATRFRLGAGLVRAVYGPFFASGALHGDPHPGNFVVRPDGSLGVLDFGSTRQVREPFRRSFRRAIEATLEGRTLDWPALLEEAGFTVGLEPARTTSLVEELLSLAGAPLRGPWDFGARPLLDELQTLCRRRTGELVRLLPPPEGLSFLRTVVGLVHDLRLLRAAGDFRPVFRELLDASRDA